MGSPAVPRQCWRSWRRKRARSPHTQSYSSKPKFGFTSRFYRSAGSGSQTVSSRRRRRRLPLRLPRCRPSLDISAPSGGHLGACAVAWVASEGEPSPLLCGLNKHPQYHGLPSSKLEDTLDAAIFRNKFECQTRCRALYFITLLGALPFSC